MKFMLIKNRKGSQELVLNLDHIVSMEHILEDCWEVNLSNGHSLMIQDFAVKQIMEYKG